MVYSENDSLHGREFHLNDIIKDSNQHIHSVAKLWVSIICENSYLKTLPEQAFLKIIYSLWYVCLCYRLSLRNHAMEMF